MCSSSGDGAQATQADLDKLVAMYFGHNGKGMYRYLHQSYADLLEKLVPAIVREHVLHRIDDGTVFTCRIGNIGIKMPCDEYEKEMITPSIARQRNLTYACSIYGDMRVCVSRPNEQRCDEMGPVHRVHIARVPVMVQSPYCVLEKFPSIRYKDECDSDHGGYFIINGNEKAVVNLERQVTNKLVYFMKESNYYVCMNTQHRPHNSIQQMTILYNVKKKALFISSNMFSTHIPLVVVIKSLGITSDREIRGMLCRNISRNHTSINISNQSMSEWIGMKVEDCNAYCASKLSPSFRMNGNGPGVDCNKKMESVYGSYLLIGTNGKANKARYLCHMANMLLSKLVDGNTDVFHDRDSYENKRFDTPGTLIGSLFKQAWMKVMRDTSVYFAKKKMQDMALDDINVGDCLRPTYIEQFIKTSILTGTWGMSRTKKGVSRVFDRLTYLKSAAELRKIIIPSIEDSTKKITSMRQVHTTQMGFVCPVDTPEGEKVGIVKNLSIMASITPIDSVSEKIIGDFFRGASDFTPLGEYRFDAHETYVNVMINGVWIGVLDPRSTPKIVHTLRNMKMRCTIGPYTSIVVNSDTNELDICTDHGRLVRPLLRVRDGHDLVLDSTLRDIAASVPQSFDEVLSCSSECCIEFVDVMECNYQHRIAQSLSALRESREQFIAAKPGIVFANYTLAEFHPSMVLGLCASTIPFINHNQAPRNTYHCSQVKHAMGFHSRVHNKRFDNTNILHDPQRPISRPRYMEHLGVHDLPYGLNIILAIMPFSGYNQEDSMILNQTSVDRGLFCSVTLKKFESSIDRTNQTNSADEVFSKPPASQLINPRNESFDKLNEDGSISVGTRVENHDVVIGKVQMVTMTTDATQATDDVGSINSGTKFIDKSITYKSLVPGTVQAFEKRVNADGYDMYRVKTRSYRVPMVGDKFTSRAGQKATCGILLRAEDMPYTKDGLVPDIIINSNCIPSRMTIGQLYEMVLSKEGVRRGEFVDATAFDPRDIAEHLGADDNWGMETMYSGITGEQYKSKVFIGPCYYTRLKHMASEKIHARSIGSNQILTRQPPEGRSKNGGFRFGEMERDACIGHGISLFLKERFMECSDQYTVCVCDICGFFASRIKDSEERWWCKQCNNFIRISKIQVPYCFKLMIQELQSVHIAMRLKTDNSFMLSQDTN